MSKITLDMRGMSYTMPVIKLARALKDGRSGDKYEVISDYSSIEKELRNWCAYTGNKLKKLKTAKGITTALVVKN